MKELKQYIDEELKDCPLTEIQEAKLLIAFDKFVSIELESKIGFSNTSDVSTLLKVVDKYPSVIISVLNADTKKRIGWVSDFSATGGEHISGNKELALVFTDKKQAEIFYSNGKLKEIGRENITHKYEFEMTGAKPTKCWQNGNSTINKKNNTNPINHNLC